MCLELEDFLPSDELTHLLATLVCPVPGLDDICGNVLFLIGGYDIHNMNYVCICFKIDCSKFMVIHARAALLSTLGIVQLGVLSRI